MKFSFPLFRMANQNLYRMMRNQWKTARKRKVIELKYGSAKSNCEAQNLEVVDANEFVANPKPVFDFSSIVGLENREIEKNESHPLYKEKPCFVYRDNSVLLEGLHQALVLTNTIQFQSDALPVKFNKLASSVQLPNTNELVKRCIKTSCLYDAEQKKLPHRKDPKRPHINLPLDYGISDVRKNRMLCSRLLHLCDLACPEISANRSVLHNVPLSVPQMYVDDNVEFQLRSDIFITSKKALSPIASHSKVEGQMLPELSVSHPLISMEEETFYELKDIFPLEDDAKFNRVHTIMVYYNPTEVGNTFETPVSESQLLGRSMIKAYTAAVAQARYTFGQSVKDLPEPVVVQCVHTDGRTFHFSILQLNSTAMIGNHCNVYWSLPPIDLYEECSYVQAVPKLEGYNPEVFTNLLGFYMNNT